MRCAMLAVAVLVACDPVVDKHTPDANRSDAAADAQSHGVVTVKVYDPTNPGTVVVGIPVVFFEADGTFVARPVTDASGVASADVHANASATSVISQPSTSQLTTIAGLQPGDNIIIGTTESNSTPDGTFSVTYPTQTGASSYEVAGPCGTSSGTGPLTLTIYPYCKQAMMDIVVVALDAGGNPLGSIEKTNVAYTPGGSVAVGGTYQGISTFNASYTNVDPAITSIFMNRTVPANVGYGRGLTGMPMNGALQLSVTDITGQTASVLSRATRGMSLNLVFESLGGSTLTYGMDMGGTLLPWIGPVTQDLAAKKVTVGTDTTGTTSDKPDMFYVNLNYSRSNGSGGSRMFTWIVVGPTVGDVTLPALPPEVGDVLPQATDTPGSTFTIALESSTLTWDMIRPAVFETLGSIGGAASMGKIRESAYQARPGLQ